MKIKENLHKKNCNCILAEAEPTARILKTTKATFMFKNKQFMLCVYLFIIIICIFFHLLLLFFRLLKLHFQELASKTTTATTTTKTKIKQQKQKTTKKTSKKNNEKTLTLKELEEIRTKRILKEEDVINKIRE